MSLLNKVSSRSNSRVRVMGLSGEDGGQGMAFATTYLRFAYRAERLCAKGFNIHFALEVRKRPFYASLKHHIRTGIGSQQIRHRAGKTQVSRPGLRRRGVCQQATFLLLSTAVVIPVEIATFFPGGSAHKTGYTLVIYEPVRVSTRIVLPSSTKLGTCTSKPVSIVHFLGAPVAVSPRTDTSALTTARSTVIGKSMSSASFW